MRYKHAVVDSWEELSVYLSYKDADRIRELANDRTGCQTDRSWGV